MPEAQYVAWRNSITASQEIAARLAGVRFDGLQNVNPEYLAKTGSVKAGDTVDTAVISREAQRLSALQDFDSVGYRLDGDRDSPTLTWLPREKSWGPNYLKIDLGMYASEDGDLTFVLYGRHARTWLNSLGAEWRNEVQLGGQVLFSTSLFQPLDAAHRFFVEPQAVYSRSLEDLFFDDERVARYSFSDLGGTLDFGVNIGRRAQARVGYAYAHRNVNVEVGSPLMPQTERVDAGILASAEYDSRDTAFSPTRGMAPNRSAVKGPGSAPSWGSGSPFRFAATCSGSRSPELPTWAAIFRRTAPSRSAGPAAFRALKWASCA